MICIKRRWLAGCMGFLWLTGFSFFHCVASPFHSFVTTSNGGEHSEPVPVSSTTYTAQPSDLAASVIVVFFKYCSYERVNG